jgi:biopolymer transport protein TolR
MNVRPNRRKPMSDINVVPYIDVMLVLLVIFMVTAPILTQGVLVDLPKAPSEPISEHQEDPLVVTVRRDGALFVNLGIRKSTDTGTRVTIFSLEEQAGKILRARPDAAVYVRADQKLEYGEVVRVMTVLQKAGAKSVGLITEPPDLG